MHGFLPKFFWKGEVNPSITDLRHSKDLCAFPAPVRYQDGVHAWLRAQKTLGKPHEDILIYSGPVWSLASLRYCTLVCMCVIEKGLPADP